MKPLRHCGICEEMTHKEFCWKCTERGNRLTRSIQKKLSSKTKNPFNNGRGN